MCVPALGQRMPGFNTFQLKRVIALAKFGNFIKETAFRVGCFVGFFHPHEILAKTKVILMSSSASLI